MKGAKTGLFIVELMLSLLIFSFCAAVCLQLFLAARARTNKAGDISQAVSITTSAAEAFKVSGGTGFHSLINAFPTAPDADPDEAVGGFDTVRYFNAAWEPAESKLDTKYMLCGVLLGDGLAEIGVYYYDEDGETGSAIFSVTVKAVTSVG